MTIAEMRQAVVAEAMTWIGTPYHTEADVKGAGVDCGMLLVRVFVDLGLVESFDPRPYPSQWHLHQRAERYVQWVEKWTRELPGPPKRIPLPGDIVLFHYGLCYGHGGIVTEWPLIIHAMGPSKVQRQRVDANTFLRKMRKRYFTIWPESE